MATLPNLKDIKCSGDMVRFFFANGKTGLILNDSIIINIDSTTSTDQETGVTQYVPQVGVELHVRAANDLSISTTPYWDIIIPSIDESIGSWYGVIPHTEMNKIPMDTIAYISIYTIEGSYYFVKDWAAFNVRGGI